MRCWRNVVLMMVMALIVFSIAKAEKEVNFSGLVYAYWYYDMSDTLDAFGNQSDVDFDSYNRFGITRTYLSAKARVSDRTFGRITVDVNPKDNNIRLKYGYIGWKCFENRQIMFGGKLGLLETPWIANANKAWSRRYISKTASDFFGLQTSADFGITLWSKLGKKGKWGNANFSILNGTSYKEPDEKDNSKDIDLTVFIKPLNAQPDFEKSIIGFQINSGKISDFDSSGVFTDDFKKTTISILANLQYNELLNLGVEYNSYSSPYVLDVFDVGLDKFANGDTSDVIISATTIFGTLWFGELLPDIKKLQTTGLFFRYIAVDADADDHTDIGYDSPNAVDPFGMKSTMMMIGLECNPVKGFKGSLNFQSDKITNRGTGLDDITNSYLYLNMMFSF